jgi:3-oxoacyl-(acyl-carrier-protein) synthase
MTADPFVARHMAFGEVELWTCLQILDKTFCAENINMEMARNIEATLDTFDVLEVCGRMELVLYCFNLQFCLGFVFR